WKREKARTKAQKIAEKIQEAAAKAINKPEFGNEKKLQDIGDEIAKAELGKDGTLGIGRLYAIAPWVLRRAQPEPGPLARPVGPEYWTPYAVAAKDLARPDDEDPFFAPDLEEASIAVLSLKDKDKKAVTFPNYAQSQYFVAVALLPPTDVELSDFLRYYRNAAASEASEASLTARTLFDRLQFEWLKEYFEDYRKNMQTQAKVKVFK